MMKTICARLLTASYLSLCMVFSVQATITDQDISIYNQAAAGNEEQVKVAYTIFSEQLKNEGATPLTLVYLGSTQTLQGRDAWMPWTKMKYVERGLANIDKSLTLLASDNQPLAQQPRYQGLQESFLIRALAATTYSRLPDMFNHFERGYELYLTLLAEPEFELQPFPARAWVYYYAIKAALRAGDQQQANQWLTVMQQQGASNSRTIDAQQMISEQ